MTQYISQEQFDMTDGFFSDVFGEAPSDKDTFDVVTEMTDYVIILSYFAHDDDWVDKHTFDTKLPSMVRDSVRSMVSSGLLIRESRPHQRTDGSSKKQKTYLSYSVAPILRPIVSEVHKLTEQPITSNTDANVSRRIISLMMKHIVTTDDFDENRCKIADISLFRRYLPYHLLRAFCVDTPLITTKLLESKYPVIEPERPKFNKKDLSKLMKEMNVSVRLDLCDDVYRYILKSGNDGVTKREIINDIWLKHAYEYTLQHIDTVCRLLIKAGYIREYDTSKELIYCDSIISDKDIPKRERLVRSKEEQKRDEYLILKVMEQCETTYRYKDIANLTGINESAVYNTVNSLAERGIIRRIEDGASAVSFANLDYEGLCREVHDKEVQYGIAKDNGHIYKAEEVPKKEEPPEVSIKEEQEDEYDYPNALARMYEGIAVVSMTSARVYHLMSGKGLRCADDINTPIESFSDEEKKGKWRDIPALKDCPFCKSPSLLRFNDERTEYWCECSECHISTRHEQSIVTAIGTWNKRL